LAKTFTPIIHKIIPASPPHPDETSYKISIGYEDWGKPQPVLVTKIQMVYQGQVSGRRAPSFPVLDTSNSDFELIVITMKEIVDEAKKTILFRLVGDDKK
jgi:hypothetical protein